MFKTFSDVRLNKGKDYWIDTWATTLKLDRI